MRPSTIDDICAVVGYTATRKLQAWYGGRKIYIPSNADPSHKFALAIGLPAFRALVAEFAVEVLSVPPIEEELRFHRNRDIAEKLAAGVEVPRIAAEYNISIRRVEQIRCEVIENGWLEYALGFRGKGPRDGAPVSPAIIAMSAAGVVTSDPDDAPPRAPAMSV